MPICTNCRRQRPEREFRERLPASDRHPAETLHYRMCAPCRDAARPSSADLDAMLCQTAHVLFPAAS